ncbi:hypothetical protein EI613_11740 [Azospirillum sp. 412522]|nr:hypothetical protein [Azospirillum sp. 412522]MBY6262579.1 hypothetical protein [Azospirillum sp. 412522]
MAKKWMAVQKNIAKDLQAAAKPKHIEIPDRMMMGVELVLDDDLYKELSKNPTWLQRLQEMAKAEFDKVVADGAKMIKKADDKAANFNEKQAAIFSKDLNVALEKFCQKAANDMAVAAEKLFDDYKKGQKELQKFSLKAAGKIGLSVVAIVGSAVSAVFSGGAASPIAILGFVKSSLTIVQELTKITIAQAGKIDAADKVISVEMKALKKMMGEYADKVEALEAEIEDKIAEAAKAKGIKKLDEKAKADIRKELEKDSKYKTKMKQLKAVQSSKEIGLNLISKAFGIETPSLKNCRSHMDVYKNSIAGIEKNIKKKSEQIYKAMDAAQALDKELAKAVKSGADPKKIGKVTKTMEAAEGALDTLLKLVIEMNVGVDKANTRYAAFDKALEAMEAGVPAWVKFVDVVISGAVDIGLSIADAPNAIEKGLGAANTAMGIIDAELIDAA